ncbi:UNVERIFIED_CONTAM: hypothetical protein K2H54_035843 [Gekko kuhli]
MESHGLPDKIHLSPTAFRALQHQGFDIVERGEIEVKGKGEMTTYFLRQNPRASENEIMGHTEENLGNSDGDGALGSANGNSVVVMKYADCQELVPSTEVEDGPDIQAEKQGDPHLAACWPTTPSLLDCSSHAPGTPFVYGLPLSLPSCSATAKQQEELVKLRQAGVLNAITPMENICKRKTNHHFPIS